MVTSAARRILAVAVALSATSAVSSAQITSYTGWNAGASVPGANAISARNAFVAATGASVNMNFEGPTPSGVNITGGILRTGGAVRGSPCALFGCNTTAGGSSFLDLYEFGATRFDFATPITYFGGFFGGMQLDLSSIRVFLSGGSQDVPLAFDFSNGGTGFYGFTSTQSISRVDVIINQDYVGVDDIMYGNSSVSVVPEPSTYALMAAGLAALGMIARRRRTRV